MSITKCPPNDDSCVDFGFPGSFQDEEPPCDNFGGLPCYYFHIGTGTAPRDVYGYEHCKIGVIDDEDADGNYPCYRQGTGWFNPLLVVGHWMRWTNSIYTFMQAREGSAFFLYDQAPFKSKGEAIYHFTFDPNTLLEVDACCLETQCETGSIWIGRVRLLGGANNWDVWCNIAAKVSLTDNWHPITPPSPSPEWCRQSIFRVLRKPDKDILLPADEGGTSFSGEKQMVFTTLGMVSIMASQSRQHCFPYTGHYCLVGNCTGGSSNPDDGKFTCVEGGLTGAIGTATATLDVAYSMALSTDFARYPFKNRFDRYIENAQLEFFATKSTSEVTHSTTVFHPETLVPYLWEKEETFEDEEEEENSFPVVTYEGSVYPGKLDGRPIIITGRSFLTGIEYPMELRLVSSLTRVEIYIEKKHDTRGSAPTLTHQHRMFADASVTVFFQVWLKPEAYLIRGPFKFIERDGTKPWDHRFEDPEHRGKEYPHDKLVVQGPNGERVRTQITWKGRVCEEPIGKGTEFVRPCYDWYNAYPGNFHGLECCSSLQMINATPIPGRNTDMSDVDVSHLFEGNIALTVPNLNESGNPLYNDCGCVELA